MRTVYRSGVVKEAICRYGALDVTGLCGSKITRYVNATSAAVNGVPFDHLTLGRMVNVIDLPPFDHL